MAKPTPHKHPSKSDATASSGTGDAGKANDAKVAAESAAPKGPASEQGAGPTGEHVAAKPSATVQTSPASKKDAAVNRTKKMAASPKGVSIMPSQHKLDHLKAAVAAAGSVDNLLLILQHVDEAGGRHEVAESVEAYRALKSAFE